MTDTRTIQQVLAGTAITMHVVRTDKNTVMEDSANMDHWNCFIENNGGQQMKVTFSKGRGLKGVPPSLEEVLDCIANDASGFDNAKSLEDWASEYGYDSRQAERTYNAIEKQASDLKRVLGDDLYETLLWNTERL